MKTTIYKNTKITYTDQGKGTAVVLLHGFYENKEMWNSFVPEFSKKHRIITSDLLGHGQSAVSYTQRDVYKRQHLMNI